MSLEARLKGRAKITASRLRRLLAERSAGKRRVERTAALKRIFDRDRTKSALAKFRESRGLVRKSRAKSAKLEKAFRASKAIEVKLREQLARQQASSKRISRFVVLCDGKPTPLWIAREVEKVRAAGRWKGHVISGWRSVPHSIAICQEKCGAPSCPGKCAGASTNHTGQKFPAGAIDVDPPNRDVFVAECRRLGIPLRNDLPRDRNHFSHTGH